MSANNVAYAGQMFDHTLTPLKGWGTHMHVVDFDANLSSNVNIGGVGNPPQSGMVVHNTANGFEMGANLTKMPIYLWPGYADNDVRNPGVPAGCLFVRLVSCLAWLPLAASKSKLLSLTLLRLMPQINFSAP